MKDIGMEGIATKSAAFMDKLLTGEAEPTRENLIIARFASSNMSNWVRFLSVKHNQERSMIRFAERVAGNPEDFARYVKAALPDSGVTKMLGTGEN